MTDALPRTGVIGTGHWGRNLLRNLDALGCLAAFSDISATAREAHAAAYPGAAAHADTAALLADPGIEAVAIATPAATHGRLVAEALAAGKHVFVEKPLCLDLAEGRTLRELAGRRRLTLMVGHLLLYHPAFRALQRAVADGAVGRLRYIYSNRASLGKIRREENALWSFAPHDISMILALVGAMPERVVANGGSWLSPPVADTTLTHLAFANGVQAHLFVSWLHPYKDHKLVVVGDAAMAVFDDTAPPEGKLTLYRHRVGWDGDVPTVERARGEAVALAWEEPLLAECRHFLACVRERRPPVSDAEEGLRVLRVLDACQRALVGGRPVTLAEEAE